MPMRHDLINRGEPWLYRGQNRECVTGALVSYSTVNLNYFILNFVWRVKSPRNLVHKNKTEPVLAYTKSKVQICCVETYDFAIHLLLKSEISSFQLSSVAIVRFVWDLIGNPEDQFSRRDSDEECYGRSPYINTGRH